MQSRAKKRSHEAGPELDTELLQKHFKCVQCSVRLKDVKLLKKHFWRVHIRQDEIFNHMNVNDKYLIKSTFTKKTPTKFETNKRKKSAASANVSSCEKAADSINCDSELISQESSGAGQDAETMHQKVKKMTSDQIRWFNLTKEQINEREIADYFRPMDDLAEFDKMRELQDGQVVWAKCGKIMWPARVDKVIRSKTNAIQKVAIKYFEMDRQKSCVFRLDPGRIQLFFRPVDSHFKNKENAFENKKGCFHFVSAYSDALEEFYSITQLEQPSNATEVLGANTWDSGGACKHFVNDRMLTNEEVVALAKAPISDKQAEVNNERLQYSRQLFAVLESVECQNYVIGILTNQIESKRNTQYLNGSPAVRKAMEFESPGPLVTEHQTALAELLCSLQQTHFVDKPSHLRNYEYDVLYPEAVIWAIQKHDESLTVRKAELKYQAGFKQTVEELTKQKCNEILANLEEKKRLLLEEERRQLEDARRLMTETRPLDSDDSEMELELGRVIHGKHAVPSELAICEEEEVETADQETRKEENEKPKSLESTTQLTMNCDSNTVEKEQFSPVPSPTSSESLVNLEF